jgi:Protein of unknown function (DUF3223)
VAISIGPKTYPSKAHALTAIRLLQVRLRTSRPTVEDTEFLHALLALHPDHTTKNGCGVERFEVRQGMAGHLQFWLIRTDGSETDFSFLKCLRPKSEREHVLSAMRRAIAGQVIEARNAVFADQATRLCPLTGEQLTADNCEMDHLIPFIELANDFVASHGGYEAIETISADGEQGRHFKDTKIEKLWEEYHRGRAILRPVSKFANQVLLPEIHRLIRLNEERRKADRLRRRGYDVDCSNPEHPEFLLRTRQECRCTMRRTTP